MTDKNLEANLCALEETADKAMRRFGRMTEVLRECEAYFADRADAEYHTDSPGAVGNEEMSLLVQIQEVLK